MRLICPNCGAQYEVPAEVIPDGGRDVQCSSCGHTWFQAHPDDDPALADDLGQPVPDESWTPEPEDEGPADTAPQDAEPQAPDPAPAAPPDVTDPVPPADTPEPAAPPHRPSRGLDPTVAEVLREEADREARQRASEAGGLESQPDLGLEEPSEDEAARRAREARDRMARMRGEDPEADPDGRVAAPAPEDTGVAAAAAATAAGSRRDLLPDIDEINQTLRSSSERREVETPQGRALMEEEQSSGFGRGFTTVIVLALIAVAIYALAPRISEWVPALAPLLDVYVTQVDVARTWLGDLIAGVLGAPDGADAEAPAE